MTVKALAGWNRYGLNAKRCVRLIFVLALILRVLFVLLMNSGAINVQTSLSTPRFTNDSFMYDALAQSIAAGRGYQFNGDYAKFTSIPPLYPIFLAVLHIVFGGRPPIIALGIIHALLGALTAILLFRLTRLCFIPDDADGAEGNASEVQKPGDRVALAAAFLFAVYPFLIFNTPYVIKETFATFLTVGFALAWAHMLHAAQGRKAFGWAALCGALGGLITLSRYPHMGLMITFVIVNLYLVWRHKRALVLRTGLALILFSLVLAPWLARNYSIFGRVVLSNHGPSRYLYNANSDLAEPEIDGSFEARSKEGRRSQHNRNVDEATRHDAYANEWAYLRAAIRAVISRPGHVLLLMGAKLINMWRPVWTGSSLRTWIALGVPYLLMMALALPGLILMARRRRDLPINVCMIVPFAIIIFYVVGHTVFYGMIRERQYVEPFLIIFAGYSLCLLLRGLKEGRRENALGLAYRAR